MKSSEPEAVFQPRDQHVSPTGERLMQSPEPDAELQRLKHVAHIIIMCVYKETKDYEAQHLPGLQRLELNTLIADAIYTALVTLHHASDMSEGKRYQDALADIHGFMRCLPECWRPPRLTNSSRLSPATSSRGKRISATQRSAIEVYIRRLSRII